MWPPSHKIKCLPARGTLAPLEVWARTPHIRGVPVYCLEPEGGHEDGPESRLGDEEERRLRQAKDKTTQIRLTICKHSTLYLEINPTRTPELPRVTFLRLFVGVRLVVSLVDGVGVGVVSSAGLSYFYLVPNRDFQITEKRMGS